MAISDIVTKAKTNFRDSMGKAKANYPKSKTRAISHFKSAGFGPKMSGNYERSWDTNDAHYQAAMNAEAERKYGERYEEATRE